MQTALRELADDPARAGSQARPEFSGDGRTYHLRNSRRRQQQMGAAVPKAPRHLIVYRQRAPDELLILRVLHDAMELSRYLPEGQDTDGG